MIEDELDRSEFEPPFGMWLTNVTSGACQWIIDSVSKRYPVGYLAQAKFRPAGDTKAP